MARYHFNTLKGEVREDTVGVELPGLREARIEAVRFAAEVLKDNPMIVWDGEDFRIEVTDEQGLAQFTVIIVGVDAPAVAISFKTSRSPSA